MLNNLTEQKQLQIIQGGILVVTEGVFGMAGDQGKLKEICEYKEQYGFRLFIDDAHGFGTVGETGVGTGEAQGVQDQIDVYFGTSQSQWLQSEHVAGDEDVIDFLLQHAFTTFAKSLPMPIVVGARKRLKMLRESEEHKNKLWKSLLLFKMD